MEDTEVQSPPPPTEEEKNEENEETIEEENGAGGDGEGESGTTPKKTRKKRPSKRPNKKDAWKGTLRKKATPKQNLQEQQEAFDLFLGLINDAPEDGRKIKGNEKPQFVENEQSVEDLGFDVGDIKLEDLDSLYSGAAQVELQDLDEEEKKRREEEERLEREEKERREKEEEERKRQEDERKREEEERRKEAERIIEAERLAKKKAEEEEEKRKLEEARLAEEARVKQREKQKAENMKKFQQMTSAPARPIGKAKDSSTANRFATMKIRTHSAAQMVLPQRRELLREGRSSSRTLIKDLESTPINSSSTNSTNTKEWESDVLSRWADFIDTAKKAKAAAAAAAAAVAKPEPVTEEKKKEKKKREDDAMLIIGALRKQPAKSESEAASEAEPQVEEEEKKRELFSSTKSDPKNDRIPYLLNMYRYRGVNVDFTDLFGEQDQFTTAGVHVWCINPQGPAIQEVDADGKLTTNGSYVILQTIGSSDSVEHKIHTWSPTTSTKFTSVAAVYAAMLTCHLGKAHVTHNVKDFEEPEFFSVFFPQEVEYTNEPLDSSLAVPTPKVPKPILAYALFQVPNKQGIIEHVAFSSKLNTENCYVLVNATKNTAEDSSIFLWIGKETSVAAKGRAFEFARDTRKYFNYEPKIFPVYEGQEPARFTRHLVKRKPKAEDEPEDEEEEINEIILYSVKQGQGKLDLKEVKDQEPPFGSAFISTTKNAIILDCTTDIFVYLAPGCPKQIRRGSEECAKLFYNHYDRPEWAKVWTISGQPTLNAGYGGIDVITTNLHPFFSQFFLQPSTPREKFTPYSEVDLKRKIAQSAEGYVKNGEGVKDESKRTREVQRVDPNRSVEVWGTVGSSANFKKLPLSAKGHFYRQDAALVVVNNPGDERTMPSAVMYWWQGAEANTKAFQKFYFGMYQALAKKMQEEDYPRPEVHFITEHKEPVEFTELFDKNIIIHLGNRVNSQNDKPRLYHLKQSSPDVTHLSEVPLKVSNLHSGDYFLLVSGNGTTYIWKGVVSDAKLQTVAESFAKQLSENSNNSNSNFVSVSEGEEPEAFWEILGNSQERNELTNKDAIEKYIGKVKMFSFSFEDGVSLLNSFWTSDLEPTKVVVLDAYYEIYVWTGDQVSGSVENYAQTWIKAYHTLVNQQRGGDTVLVEVKSNDENEEFKRHFHSWFRPEKKQDVLEVRREEIKKKEYEEYREKIRDVYFKTFGEQMPDYSNNNN